MDRSKKAPRGESRYGDRQRLPPLRAATPRAGRTTERKSEADVVLPRTLYKPTSDAVVPRPVGKKATSGNPEKKKKSAKKVQETKSAKELEEKWRFGSYYGDLRDGKVEGRLVPFLEVPSLLKTIIATWLQSDTSRATSCQAWLGSRPIACSPSILSDRLLVQCRFKLCCNAERNQGSMRATNVHAQCDYQRMACDL